MSLDLRHVRPGEVITDCYGNVWGKFEDGRIVPLMLAGGHPVGHIVRNLARARDFGPFTRLVPEEREEW